MWTWGWAKRAAAAARAVPPELQGLFLQAVGMMFVSVMTLFAKVVQQAGVPVFEVVLARSAVLLAFSAALLKRGGINPLKSDRWVPSAKVHVDVPALASHGHAGQQGMARHIGELSNLHPLRPFPTPQTGSCCSSSVGSWALEWCPRPTSLWPCYPWPTQLSWGSW